MSSNHATAEIHDTDLQALRTQIDAVDQQLAQLFCQRMRLSAEVAHIKSAQDLPLIDHAREKHIMERLHTLVEPELAPYSEAFFALLFAISKDYQTSLHPELKAHNGEK